MIAQYMYLLIITNIILVTFAICVISVYKKIGNVLIKTNKRIDDLFVCLNVVQENNKYTNEMFDKFNAIIYTSSSFGQKVKQIDMPAGNAQDAGSFVNYADKMVDQANKKAVDLEKKLDGVNNNGK